jgi:hypothetical protein
VFAYYSDNGLEFDSSNSDRISLPNDNKAMGRNTYCANKIKFSKIQYHVKYIWGEPAFYATKVLICRRRVTQGESFFVITCTYERSLR